jgi:lysine 2,3-aminomutase
MGESNVNTLVADDRIRTTEINGRRIVGKADIAMIMDRYHYSDDTRSVIDKENLLPAGVLSRLHSTFPQHSGILDTREFMFTGKKHYSGKKGFREIVAILEQNGIDIGHIKERELFIDVYRFLATSHVLNKINWDDPHKDPLFQLVIPQPGMIRQDVVGAYLAAETDEQRRQVVSEHQQRINPHDGKQLLNKPWYQNEDGDLEILRGSQHKYPPCQLIFDKTTQSCFAFCTYCFRHAQVRGDEDMFVQDDINQVHEYLKKHREVSDMLITGGDAGYIPHKRLAEYVMPLIHDDELMHVKTLRLGSRALTFHPEMMLSSEYDPYLEIYRTLYDNGIQVVWMAHFSTPREVLNPSTIAAIRRLRANGVTIRSQSPIMNHISLFKDEQGRVDVDRSAQNWIDLGFALGMLGVGFHSMYCARPTGEHHYFTAPLADIEKIFSKVYRTLPSINRPSRYITMTSSAGKVSLIGTAEVKGEKVFVLKFNEGRNMQWMDRVFLARYDEEENTIEKLKPFDTEKYFYEDDLVEIEQTLEQNLQKKIDEQ